MRATLAVFTRTSKIYYAIRKQIYYYCVYKIKQSDEGQGLLSEDLTCKYYVSDIAINILVLLYFHTCRHQ